ncbi:methyl-accepting chemotaxis protein [Salinimonas chungwhensis]|uniref:methyl-accepting chemotaxis protein n=1 Tax=Salinimonas chungwhensis TaxID=265425 RepID=UPI000360F5D0|nr:PAS domain-containing methyl-accepting chemotaxis protein [Salinimonas chungwhensis]
MFNQKLKEALFSSQNENAMYRQIIDSLKSEMLHLTLSPHGEINAVNEWVCNELNFSKNELLGKTFTQLVPERSRSTNHYQQMCDAINRQEHWSGAVEIDNGKNHWVRIILQPVFDVSGKCLSIDIFGSNLTRTIETSRENENMISALTRSMAVIEFTPDGYITHANDLFLNTVGYKLDEIKGKHHRIFCTEEEKNSQQYQDFWHRLNQGQFVASRFKRVNKSGQTIWLEASYNPIFDAYGKLYKMVKFATDITAQVQREMLVNDAAEFAAQTSSETGDFASHAQQLMKNTEAAMAGLASQMERASQQINSLEEQSKSVSSMVNSIGGIADQTNLLALNAAIEAARAGDQGRGFAVVADEVRELASRTSRSTEEIIRVFAQTDKLTGESVLSIQESLKTAENVMNHIQETSQTINNIHEGAQKVGEAVSQLSNRLE